MIHTDVCYDDKGHQNRRGDSKSISSPQRLDASWWLFITSGIPMETHQTLVFSGGMVMSTKFACLNPQKTDPPTRGRCGRVSNAADIVEVKAILALDSFSTLESIQSKQKAQELAKEKIDWWL